jgi:DNA-binding IscR family transcriptional regulator
MEPRQLRRRNSLIVSSSSGSGGGRRLSMLGSAMNLPTVDEALALPEHLTEKFSEAQTASLQRIFRYGPILGEEYVGCPCGESLRRHIYSYLRAITWTETRNSPNPT